MKIKTFCEKYMNLSGKMQEQYWKDNIVVKKYISFLKKTSIAEQLVKITTINTKTGNIYLNSPANYLFFCRIVIELYTNLEVESEGFYEEYDILNSSGILDKIMQSIPEKELKELKMLCDMAKEDLIFNNATPRAYIDQQVEKFTSTMSIALSPMLDKIIAQLENLDDKDKKKIIKMFDYIIKK